MREFRVTLTHKAGELARLCDLLANRELDLRSVAGMTNGNKADICLVVEDVTLMRATLTDARMQFEESEVVSELMEDGPGAVAHLCRRLAEANVSINSLYILARDNPLVEIGMTVDDPKKAKKALG